MPEREYMHNINLHIHPTKKKRSLVKESVSVTLFFSDVIAMCISFLLAIFTAPLLKDLFFPDIYSKPLLDYSNISDLFFIWMCPLVLFVFFTQGHYTQRVPWWSQVGSVLYICLIAFIIDGFTRFALQMSFSRVFVGLSWIYVFFLTIGARQLVYIYSRRIGLWRIPTIVIGDIGTVTDILYAFSTDHYTGYNVVKVILRDRNDKEFNLDHIPKKYKNIKIVRENIDFTSCIERHPDHFFVVSLETFRGRERDSIIQNLVDIEALYAVVPPISRISLSEMQPRHFFGYDIMLLHAHSPIHSIFGKIIKRTMDILISAAALLALSPIIFLVSLSLKLEGQGGSIFYGGHRIGRHGEKFKCWKFRSMEPNSDHLLYELLDNDPEAKRDWEIFRKLKQEDPRVTTKTARIIRKTSIDEIPQIWNVFIGDMSLVGPRPILDNERELFGDSINHYLQVRPGITGLWQVSGRNETSFQRRVYWDGWYVRNWSVWGDIVILIKTIRVVLCRDGAY